MIYYATVFILVIILYRFYRQPRNPLLPGPRPLPIIGNLHQAPSRYAERVYHEWTKKYGPIFKLQYGLQPVIILGDYETAHELLDKRSNIYSSRPSMPMAGQCVGKGLHTLFMPYDSRFRVHQRLQMSYLNSRAAQSYTSLQDLESKQVLFELLSTNEFANRYARFSASLIISLAYGKRLPRGDEPELGRIQKVVDNFIKAAQVGKWIVDAIPRLNYLPTFLAPWKRYANQLYEYESTVHSENFATAQQSPSWNWCKQLSSKIEAQAVPFLELAYNVGITFMAGTDTVSINMEFFTLAMLLNPHVQQKAQAELDRVVGGERLPAFSDKDSLPYVNAIIQEVLRWRPVIASGMPHAVMQDDEYKGYHIPVGSIVMANAWALGHDESIFPFPESVRPERWIENPNLPVFAWGFGRRACPGKHVALNSLFILISRILWAFDIEHAYEEVIVEGRVERKRCEVDSLDLLQAMSSRPKPFKVVFKSRRQSVGEVVKREWEGAEKDLSVLMGGIGLAQKS